MTDHWAGDPLPAVALARSNRRSQERCSRYSDTHGLHDPHLSRRALQVEHETQPNHTSLPGSNSTVLSPAQQYHDSLGLANGLITRPTLLTDLVHNNTRTNRQRLEVIAAPPAHTFKTWETPTHVVTDVVVVPDRILPMWRDGRGRAIVDCNNCHNNRRLAPRRSQPRPHPTCDHNRTCQNCTARGLLCT